MRRWLIALAALLLVLGVAPMAAIASGGDDDSSGSDRTSSDSDSHDDDDDDDDSPDGPDDSDGRTAGDDDDRDEDRRDDDDEVEDDDDDGHHQRRHRNRGGNDDDGSPVGGGPEGQQPTTGPAPNSATVQIADRAFEPGTIRVAVGGAVTWENVSREHTVSADDGSFDSGVIDQGQNFSKTFAAAGTFGYLCQIHPEMTGQVVVGDGPAGTASKASSSSASQSAPRVTSTGRSAGTSGGTSGQPSLGSAPAPITAAAASSADVDVRDFEFVPGDVTVAPGGTVRWQLTGTAPHTVTSDSFDSGMLKAGDTYEQAFNDIGTVAYRCDLHPQMQGTITVAETAAPTTDTGGAGSGADRGAAADASAAGNHASPAGEDAGAFLAQSGFGGVPALLGALAIILTGWAAIVTGRRRGAKRPT